jgi:hypothetical protein
MPIGKVALISEVAEITPEELAQVTAALQRQVTEHFAPIWKLPAVVNHFPTLESVAYDYFPIIVKTDIGDDAAGVHRDDDGQPMALVRYSPAGWSAAVSHELLEMLADPSLNYLVPGPSPRDDQGQVEFLVEVCDPCQAFTYPIGDVQVSDFCTRSYFAIDGVKGRPYSYADNISEPWQVLRNGYIQWRNPDDQHWWRLFFDGQDNFFRDEGSLPASERSRGFRAALDRRARHREAGLSSVPAVAGSGDRLSSNSGLRSAQAAVWRRQIRSLLRTRKP